MLADLDAQGGNLAQALKGVDAGRVQHRVAKGVGQAHVDARGAAHAVARDAQVGQGVDQRGLDAKDVFLDVDAQPAQVHQGVGHHLPGPVIRDLATAVGAHHRDVAGQQQVFVAPGHALGENGVVLDQPELVFGVGAARRREGAHGGFNFCVRAPAQVVDVHGWPCLASAWRCGAEHRLR